MKHYPSRNYGRIVLPPEQRTMMQNLTTCQRIAFVGFWLTVGAFLGVGAMLTLALL